MKKPNVHRISKDKAAILAELRDHFSYLPEDEREEIISGDHFVKVPKRELEDLRVPVYDYLIR